MVPTLILLLLLLLLLSSSIMSRSQRFWNRIYLIGDDLADHGQGALSTSQQIMRGVGSNLTRFFKGISNTVTGSLDAGQSVGSFGDAMEYLGEGQFSDSAESLKNAMYYAWKSGWGTAGGATQTASSFVPVGVLGSTGLLSYGLYRKLKNNPTIQKIANGNYDDLADRLFQQVQQKTGKAKAVLSQKTKLIKKKQYQNFKKSKQKSIPETIAQAQILNQNSETIPQAQILN